MDYRDEWRKRVREIRANDMMIYIYDPHRMNWMLHEVNLEQLPSHGLIFQSTQFIDS